LGVYDGGVSFLSPNWAWLGLLAGPIVLLYLLKIKRQPKTISSTLLWRQCREEIIANTPFRFLRRNLLLILQLLILGCLVLAMTRPVVHRNVLDARQGVIVLDASASMQALESDSRSRLDHALDEAEALIRSMGENDLLMLITAGGAPDDPRCGFTSDKVELLETLGRVKPRDLPCDQSEALQLALSALNAARDGKRKGGKVRIWLISDGAGVRLPDKPQLADKLQVIRVGKNSENVGVVRLTVRHVRLDRFEIFAAVANFGTRQRELVVSLDMDTAGQFVRARKVSLAPRGREMVVFKIRGDKTAKDPGRKVFVNLDIKDALGLDNRGYAVLEHPRQAMILFVGPKNPAIQRFLFSAARKGMVHFESVETSSYNPKQAREADLVIFNRWTPESLPMSHCLIIHPERDIAGWTYQGPMVHPQLLRWNRLKPELRFVNLSDLVIGAAGRYASAEAEALMSAADAALMSVQEEKDRRIYLLAFDPAQSTWPREIAWPIFMGNLVSGARGGGRTGSVRMLRTGQPIRLGTVLRDAEVVGPSGRVYKVSGGGRAVEFPLTGRAGFYQVRTGAKTRLFAANLLSSAESDIRPRRIGSLRDEADTPTGSARRVPWELWPFLALAGLILLAVEWFCYHRRIG